MPYAKTNKKFKEAFKKGIPTEIRGVAWMKMIGNALRITKNLYDLIIQ